MESAAGMAVVAGGFLVESAVGAGFVREPAVLEPVLLRVEPAVVQRASIGEFLPGRSREFGLVMR